MSYETFARQYIDTALWASTDENCDPLDNWATAEDIDPGTLQEMAEDCDRFYNNWSPLIEHHTPRAGHDFWLTRNRHGAGFWDGDWPKHVGNLLTIASHEFGEFELYDCEDGKIYSF